MVKEAFLLDNQLCFRLYTAARLTMGAYHPYLTPLGITYPQYLVMLVLWEKDNRPVCDIGKRLLLETNTLTPLLQRMEKAGLVTRTRGKEDSRQRIVSLTAAPASCASGLNVISWQVPIFSMLTPPPPPVCRLCSGAAGPSVRNRPAAACHSSAGSRSASDTRQRSP